MRLINNNEYDDIFCNVDGIDRDNYIIVHLKVVPAENYTLDEVAALIAINTSLGSLTPLPYEDQSTRTQVCAKVLHCSKYGEHCIIHVAFPINICDPLSGVAQLLTVILYTAEYNFTKGYWIEDLEIPKAFALKFKGPKFGICGIRNLFNIPQRPILGQIIKPRYGSDLSYFEEYLYECLIGGFDYIIDDELIFDPKDSLSFRNRVGSLVKIADKASKVTGEKKAYIVNVNAGPKRAVEYAFLAKSLGADGIHINAFAMGFPTATDIAEDVQIQMPIFTCNMGTAILTRPSQVTGISEVVISKLSRLAGMDAVYSGIVSSMWYSEDVFRASLAALRKPFNHLKEVFPVVAGGLSIDNLIGNLIVQGKDILLQGGSTVLGFPAGPKAISQAFRIIVNEYDVSMTESELQKRIVTLANKMPVLKEVFIHQKKGTK